MIDDLINSEYNNAGELFGLDAVNKMMKAANPVQQALALKKVVQSANTSPSRRSRGEMEKHFKQLPNHVKDELKKGSIRLSDYTIYSIKKVNSKTIKLFESQDDKEVGVRNISNAKLPKNTVFLVSGIYLLAGQNPDITNAEGYKTINFRSVVTVPAIVNGEFSLKANRKQLIPENQSIRRFATDNDMTIPLGYYKLDNPRVINDEELIEFTVELGTSFSIPAETWLYVALDGTMTTP
ncbi:MAG: hypothetical protein A3D31_17520 [Candidatus Fluviicola riflensis]|nr:MAG: hypothetical protein CHH17_02460 [Candidatus Fluviicola riflensis]OGS76784.1 MAG: hypothetical protein A3D31_17520 [Candidatus Fluviicola riflensis]OGS82861.1 MAG: hypothetical protein A2724_13840 [Fluviicola sp. RIFCSPHIGHO2_01_FULL_43_53]OGS88514.1 MAG: hypothetical protein A3E30_07025 [Fluviicola sp. RIFCSPHIGHO2_12_FULL_43_24]